MNKKAGVFLAGVASASIIAGVTYWQGEKEIETNISKNAEQKVKSKETLKDVDFVEISEGGLSEGDFQIQSDVKMVASTSALQLTPPMPDYTGNVDGAPTTDAEVEENRVKKVSEHPISTFSADADDGSYKLFKANLNKGHLLDEDMIRTEEFINAFDYDYPAPDSKDLPFRTSLSVIPSPWSDNYLLRIGVKGFEYTLDELPPVNLTFLVDVSGSMREEMNVIQSGLKMLVNKLRPTDRISIVTYAGNTRVALKNTEIKNAADIEEAIDALSGGGSTNGESGIMLAYKENERNFIEKGVNRVILMSDGDFNVGLKRRDSLEELIKEKRKTGVTFSTVGIGGSNYQDQMMEVMANKGNGVYTFLGDINDARDVFADRFVQTIKTIAKDVKYQIEFNPDNVKEYRLIGYENRLLNKEDFNNDNVDAGELPSGSSTTAIYEITLADQKGLHPEKRYGKEKGEKKADKGLSEELAQLNIRFKLPEGKYSEMVSFFVNKSLLDMEPNKDTVFAAHVAGFTQIYKNSDYISDEYTYDTVLEALDEVELTKEHQPFYYMVKTTKALKETK